MAREKAVPSGRKRYMGSPTSPARAAANIKGMSSPGSPEAASPTKRSPRKPPAPRGKWSEEQLMTSDRSALIDADLVKLLASSAAWHFLDESEKREVLALLPSDVHPNPEPPADNPAAGIPALPDSFVRYSNNWRDGIRQFQIDLQNGFYDPEWLRQANEARQERASGAFDSFKEREYEEFWGQKQKLDWRALTGEAAKVKLGTLVQAGLVQVGDVWKFKHLLGKGDEQQSVEKETRVEEIHGSKLTFVMPAGQRVFLRSGTTDSPNIEPEDQPHGEDKKTLEVKNETVSETMADSYSPPHDKEDPDLKMEDPKSETPVAPHQEMDPIIIKSENDEIDTPKQSSDQEATLVPADADSPPAITKSGGDERDTAAQPNNRDVDSVLSTPLSSPRSLSPPWSLDGKEDESQGIQPNIEVVIRSPSKMPAPQPKRPVPQPAAEPERKRRRGRPRKPPLESQSDQEQSDFGFEEELEPEIVSADSPEFRVVLNSVPTLDPTEYRQYEPQSPTKRNNATDMLSEESSEPTKSITAVEAPATEGLSPANMDVDVDMDMDIIELVPNNEPDQQSVPDKMETASSSESAEVPAVETTDTPVQAEQTPLSSHSESADAPAAGIAEAPVQLESTPLSTSNPESAEQQAMDTTAPVQSEPAPSSPPATQPTKSTNNEPEEVTVHDIISPNALVQKILSVDGRKTGARVANAWRDIRCYRNNQDMGSLWDIRQAWFLKNET